MMDPSTGAMQNFSAQGLPSGGGPEAGLVLLYAEGFASLPPAFTLVPGPLVIGRDPDVDIPVPVSAVSRRQAGLRSTRGLWIVRDLGSTNGALVGSPRIDEAGLEPNAELRVGDAICRLVERAGTLYAGYGLDGRKRPGH